MTVASLKELAAAVGRTAGAICHWKKEASWKKAGLPDKAPFDVEAVRRWMRANLGKTPADAGGTAAQRKRKQAQLLPGDALKAQWRVAEKRMAAAKRAAARAGDGPGKAAKRSAALSAADEPADAGDTGGGADGDGDDAEPVDLTAARVRNLNARSDKIGLEKSILEGEYVKRGDVMKAWAGRVATVRAALEAIPKRLEPAFSAVSGSERIYRELELEIRSILGTFARGDPAPAKVADAMLALWHGTLRKDKPAIRAAIERLEMLRGTIRMMEDAV